jgi:hypothetical protein
MSQVIFVNKWQTVIFQEMLLPGEEFHSNICIASKVSYSEAKYFVTLKDRMFGVWKVGFLITKEEVYTMLEFMLKEAFRDTKTKAISLKTYNATKIVTKDIKAKLERHLIFHEKSALHVKQQNCLVEEENQTLCDNAWCLLFNINFTKVEKQKPMNRSNKCSSFIKNCTPENQSNGKMPFECWFGCKPTLHHIKIFSTNTFVKIPK